MNPTGNIMISIRYMDYCIQLNSIIL